MVSTLELLVFINQAVYCYALVPLILENKRLKTARGLSDALLWSFFNALLALTFYFFSLEMPFCYRLSVVVQVALLGVLILQRFWYDSFFYKKLLAWIYLANLLGAALCIPVAIAWPNEVGNIAGWIGVVLIVANRIPQILKVQREQSVFGFSYGFAFLLGMAGLMEMTIVLVYGLPLQTLMTAAWSVVSFLIFTAQFYAFSWRQR